jgi:hypothetical protein
MDLVTILIGNDVFYLFCLGWPQGPSLHSQVIHCRVAFFNAYGLLGNLNSICIKKADTEAASAFFWGKIIKAG